MQSSKWRNYLSEVLHHVPNDVAKDAQLAETIDELNLLPRPHHVVEGGGGLDHVHQDVGVPLLRVTQALKGRLSNLTQSSSNKFTSKS